MNTYHIVPEMNGLKNQPRMDRKLIAPGPENRSYCLGRVNKMELQRETVAITVALQLFSAAVLAQNLSCTLLSLRQARRPWRRNQLLPILLSTQKMFCLESQSFYIVLAQCEQGCTSCSAPCSHWNETAIVPSRKPIRYSVNVT